ncbi:MAG: Spo0B C-terminal domain-containing protein [Bacillus sp. (in: firmicutes)]
MDKQWGIIELLNYSRHDWLNKIQLIKGNIELNKLDDVKDIIDSIIVEAKNEALLANMQMPKLAELLMTSNWREFVFSIEYEVSYVRNGCESIDKTMYNWTEAYLNMLNKAVDPFTENELKIVIDEIENRLCFAFDLQGKIIDKQLAGTFLKEYPSSATISIASFTNEELVFVMEWESQTQ